MLAFIPTAIVLTALTSLANGSRHNTDISETTWTIIGLSLFICVVVAVAIALLLKKKQRINGYFLEIGSQSKTESFDLRQIQNALIILESNGRIGTLQLWILSPNMSIDVAKVQLYVRQPFWPVCFMPVAGIRILLNAITHSPRYSPIDPRTGERSDMDWVAEQLWRHCEIVEKGGDVRNSPLANLQ